MDISNYDEKDRVNVKERLQSFDPSNPDDVREIQQMLNKAQIPDTWGNPLSEDSMFGPKTESAVRRAQEYQSPSWFEEHILGSDPALWEEPGQIQGMPEWARQRTIEMNPELYGPEGAGYKFTEEGGNSPHYEGQFEEEQQKEKAPEGSSPKSWGNWLFGGGRK